MYIRSVGYSNQCGSPPPPCTSFHARGTIDCSSGLSKFPNGRPYSIPTKRSAPAPARIAASAVPAPPQRVSAQRWAARLNRRRGVSGEAGDVSCSDDDRIDSRPLELVHLVAARHRDVCDRQLSGRQVRKQVERTLQRVRAVVLADGKEEDLRIEPLERALELLGVAHLDDAVETVIVVAVTVDRND